nr:ORF1 [Torque teno mini virus 18]
MPWWYRRRQRRWNTNWRRRRRPFTWRTRAAVRRRRHRQYRVRRWRRYKRYFKRKLPKIRLNQWQPTTIRNCSIKGNLPLLMCGQGRVPHNFTMWAESIVPEGEPGGGGWSYIQLTLRALWDEYRKYRSWWTKGNEGLPLVKFRYTKLTFYRSKWTDYIVIVKRCPPFSVTREDYLDTQPGRMLMNVKKILVPHLGRKQYKKTYITRRIPPPSLWQNKWYFQQDVCNLPLFILKTCAASLDQFYQPDTQISNNITIWSLNTDMFQNPQWHPDGTQGYIPKHVLTQAQLKPVYIYGHETGETNTANWKWTDLVKLANTTQLKAGTKLSQTNPTTTWGNPFHPQWLSKDVTLWYSFETPTSNYTENISSKISQFYYIFEPCRYNPLKDTGEGNKVYFKSTKLSQGTFTDLPGDNILITEFPLWLIFWAYTDWIQKAKPIQHISEDYQIVVQSKFINPKRNCYVFVDKYMWGADMTHQEFTETDKVNWHPKYAFQTEVENAFAETGPAAPKLNHNKSFEANIKYNVKLKWGGCPAPMETISNPCEQEKYPTPSNINSRLEITNPETEKETFLYRWDERDCFITATAAKRLKTDHSTKKSLTDFPSLNPPIEIKTTETSETSSEEEDQTPLLKQLHKLNKRKQLLRDRLRRLIKSR